MPTLNNEAVARLPFASSGQYVERDDKLPGFFVVVGKTRKTFTVQVEGRKPDGIRTSRREKISTFPDMNASAARERARAVQIELGKRRPREEPDAYTLRRGWDAYRDLMVRKVAAGEKSDATLANYDRAYRHLEDWGDKTLAEISASTELVQRRFRDISDGRVIARNLRGERVLRTSRRCFWESSTDTFRTAIYSVTSRTSFLRARSATRCTHCLVVVVRSRRRSLPDGTPSVSRCHPSGASFTFRTC